MKRIALLIAVPLVIFATAAVAQRQWIVGPPRAGGVTSSYFDDDTVVGFGNTSAAPDCWLEWDTAGTDDFELKCTDVDGAGTDGIIFSVDTGTDDVVFVGNVSTVAGTVSAEQVTSTDDATVTDNLSCGDATITEAAGVLSFTGATSNGITITAAELDLPTVDIQGNDLLNVDDAYQSALTSDTLPRDGMIKAQDAWPQSTTAANYVGADLVLAGGTGARVVTITNVANLAGDTLTFSVMDNNGVIAATGANIVTEGVGDVNCVGAGLTTAQCACAYHTRILTTTPITGVVPSRTDGTCSDSKIFFGSAAGTVASIELYYVSGGTVGLTSTERLDGYVTVASHAGIKMLGANMANAGTTLTAGSGTLSIGGGLSGGATGLLYDAGNVISTARYIAAASDQIQSAYEFQFSSTTNYSGAKDVGLKRSAAGLLGVTDGAGNFTGDLSFDDAWEASATTDVAPRTKTISTQGPINQAAQPTNDDGANLVLAPTSAWKGITGVTRAAVAEGATVTLTIQADGVVSTCVKTEGAGAGGTFECNGAATDDECVTNLKATYTATPCTGVTVSVVTGETMGFTNTPGTASRIALAVSDTDIAIATGTDGAVYSTAITYIGSPAQGIKLDAATTDGRLLIQDEVGTSAALGAYAGFYSSTTTYFNYTSLTLGDASAQNVTTPIHNTTVPTYPITLRSGAQTNAGDYASGAVNVYTGATTTDGNTGAVNIYTGAAGAGAADAGNITLATNGAPGVGTTGFQILGATGKVDMLAITQGDLTASCTLGQVALDTANTPELCICQNTNTWYCVAIADTTGPAD